MRKAKKALASLPWVEGHSVNFSDKTATITVNEKYDEKETIKALKGVGFGATIL